MSTHGSFSDVQKGPVDRMFELKKRYDADKTPSKVDLGAGVLRDEQGQCHEFTVLQKASEAKFWIKMLRSLTPMDQAKTIFQKQGRGHDVRR